MIRNSTRIESMSLPLSLPLSTSSSTHRKSHSMPFLIALPIPPLITFSPSPSLSHIHTVSHTHSHSFSLSFSLTLTHTHTHTVSLSHVHTQTHYFSLSLSFSDPRHGSFSGGRQRWPVRTESGPCLHCISTDPRHIVSFLRHEEMLIMMSYQLYVILFFLPVLITSF